MQADPESEIWRDYIDYIDEAVLDGFYKTISCSLKYLLNNTDKEMNDIPLLECKLELQAPEMIFQPSLEQVLLLVVMLLLLLSLFLCEKEIENQSTKICFHCYLKLLDGNSGVFHVYLIGMLSISIDGALAPLAGHLWIT